MGGVAPWLRVLAPLLLIGCGAGRAMQPRGLEPAPTTADLLDATLAPRRVAVLVGVDAYDDPAFVDLRFAGADAAALGERLSAPGSGDFDEVVVLDSLDETSRSRILTTLRTTLRDLTARDTVVVYFSGHGSRVPDGERWRRFLLARDSEAGDLERTAIDLAALEDWFGTLAPARKALILDTCFSGDGKSVVRPGAEPTSESMLIQRTSPRDLDAGEIHLHATTPGRASFEDPELGHGVYTHFLLQALSWDRQEADLDHDRVVTAWEAHDHARSRTLEWTKNAQSPEATLRVVGLADVILAGRPDTRIERNAVLYLFGDGTADLSGSRVVIDGQARGSFPGAFAVPPGRHDVSLTSPDGEQVYLDGRMNFVPGRAYSAPAVAVRTRGPNFIAGVSLTSTHTPVLSSVDADPAVGVEVAMQSRRRQGSTRGLTLSGAVGAAWSSSHTGPRRSLTSHLGIGWTALRGPGRVYLGVGASTLVVPAASERPGAVLGGQGWYLTTFGPELAVGLLLADPVDLELAVRPRLGALDLDGDGHAQAVGAVTPSIGLRRRW